MNTIGNTSDKSWGNDLHPSENRQGMLADLRPSSPGPPRAAAVAHQQLSTSLAQAHPPVGERLSPARATGQISATLFNEALEAPFGWTSMASVGESADLLDSIVNRLLSDDYEAYDPEGPNIRALLADHAAALPDTNVPPFGGALEAPSDQASLASVGESADLLDSIVNRLLSDDYEVYDPEDPNVRALMADYAAALPDADAPAFGSKALEAPSDQASLASVGESADLFDSVVNRLLSDDYEVYDPEDPNVRALMADYAAALPDTDAPAFGSKALEAPSDQASLASVGESADLLDSIVNRLLSDDYEVHDPEDPNVRALMADYEAMILDTGLDTDAARLAGPSADPDHAREKKRTSANRKRTTGEQRQAILHSFETDPERSNPSLANEFGVSYSTIRQLRIQFSKTGNIEPGDRAHRLTGEQRRAILHSFETDPERSNQSLADEFGVTKKTIRLLRARFGKTGDIKSGDLANRLTGEQRQAVLHIFEADSKRSNQSIADDFGVTIKTIQLLRARFGKTGGIKSGDRANRLTGEQRQAVLHIFEADSKRSNQSIADDFGVTIKTIQLLKARFNKTGDIKSRDLANRLTGELRRAILHVFETDPERSIPSIADEFGVAYSTIQMLRHRFGKTGDIKRGDHANRLTGEQRQAILHIFKTNPERTSQSITDEFGVAYTTIQTLRKQFEKTGDIKRRDLANRLTDDRRQAISHIFETDPKRKSESIADEFDVSVKTIRVLRKQFNKTGNIKPGDRAKRLTDDQRHAILRIFEMDRERSMQRISDEFGVAYATIQKLRKQFDKTGDIKRGDSAKRLTGYERRAILHIVETDPKRKNESIADEFGVSVNTIKTLKRQFGKT